MVAVAEERPYGKRFAESIYAHRNNQPNWFTYTIEGQRVGLSRYRLYDADLGIFLSRDFLRYLNKYRCWGNDPQNQVDWNGLASSSAVAGPKPGTARGGGRSFPGRGEIVNALETAPIDASVGTEIPESGYSGDWQKDVVAPAAQAAYIRRTEAERADFERQGRERNEQAMERAAIGDVGLYQLAEGNAGDASESARRIIQRQQDAAEQKRRQRELEAQSRKHPWVREAELQNDKYSGIGSSKSVERYMQYVACEKGWRDCERHHIATVESGNSGEPGWTPLYKTLFSNLQLDMNSWENICYVCDIGDGFKHQGPHDNRYHQVVYGELDRIRKSNLSLQEKQRRAKLFLRYICVEMNKSGRDLREWVTGPGRTRM